MNILAIGDHASAPYHPFTNIDVYLKDILKPHNVVLSDNYDDLCIENLSKYDLLISYVDAYKTLGKDEHANGILEYIQNGGNVLYLHGTICMQVNEELSKTIGAFFTGHPKRKDLNYTNVGTHAITNGIGDFTLFEEPYQFDFKHGADCKVFLQFELDGEQCPAAWEQTIGESKIVYLQPGHDLSVFEDKNVTALVKNAVEYLAK